MTNLVCLPKKPAEKAAVPEVVETLEGLLQRAKDGDITAFAYALCEPNGDTSSGWNGAEHTRDVLSVSVMCLQHRFTHSLLYGED